MRLHPQSKLVNVYIRCVCICVCIIFYFGHADSGHEVQINAGKKVRKRKKRQVSL